VDAAIVDPLIAFGGAIGIKVLDWLADGLRRGRKAEAERVRSDARDAEHRLDRIEASLSQVRETVSAIAATVNTFADWAGWPRLEDRPRRE
jgi:hypothetical protein